MVFAQSILSAALYEAANAENMDLRLKECMKIP